MLLSAALLVVVVAACASRQSTLGGIRAPVPGSPASRDATAPALPQSRAPVAHEPSVRGEAPDQLTPVAPPVVAALEASGARSKGEVHLTTGTGPTVEDLLDDGLYLSGASPVHLAIRGTAGAGTLRCAWRGIARTAAQREGAIRFWLRLGEDEPVPSPAYLEILFTVILDTLNPDLRETAKANFQAIARGGLSSEFLNLTCFADYTVSSYLLGSGPSTVTVAYDPLGEAASYELYRREHEAGTFGSDPLQTRGDYEASLQAIVVEAEEALAAEIGGKERIVFVAPMGAHNAIAFEAWQAVAHWDVVTETDGTVNAVRVGAPVGDPEHTQTLADLETRITTAAASDAHAGSRIADVSGLQGYYQTIGAYGDITPDDGQTTTFTPAQPPAAPTCTNGTAVATPNDNRGLVHDCETLLTAKDALRGTATLDWTTSTAIGSWEGVTIGGIPSRVTELDLASESLTGTIPADVGHLFSLTMLDLSHNQLTGDIPAELGWLTNLTELRLSGNSLTGCIPLSLRSVAANDLSSLNLPFCQPPAPSNLSAGTPGERSLALSWDAVPDAGAYRVEYRTGDPEPWTTASDAITITTHTVHGLQCETSYDVRVSAFGGGTTYAAAWSEPSAVFTTGTGACTPPGFVGVPYTFAVNVNAAVGAAVGTVTATDAEGADVSYALTGGHTDADGDAMFAIDAASGAITVAGALDRLRTPYVLTAAATDEAGGTETVDVTVRLTDVDYDANDDGLIEIWRLAQLNAIRWDLEGDGTSSDTRYADAFFGAVTGMGCPTTGCTGYELVAALDFDTDGDGTADADDAYWQGGLGWEPIGTRATPFAATFDGNGHLIVNLFIARDATDGVGLFGATGATGVLRRVRLAVVDVTGNDDVGGLVGYHAGTIRASSVTGAVAGNEDTGGLVGRNAGAISASYVTGTMTGAGRSSGLDYLGGLVGRNEGTIVTSYAIVDLTGDDYTGGLVGQNEAAGTITASYATGDVDGDHHMGGLVGRNAGTITASYATGAPSGNSSVGGLTGEEIGGSTVTTSYWDTGTSGRTSGGGGTGKTTSELQTPTGYADIYAEWNVDVGGDSVPDDPWHFGTPSQYPVLQVDFDGDGTVTWQGFGGQRAIVPPEFTAASYTFDVVEDAPLGAAVGTVFAFDGGGGAATHTIAAATVDGVFAIDAATGEITVAGSLADLATATQVLTVAATDAAGGTATVAVTVLVRTDYDKDDDGLLEVRRLDQLHAMRWDLDGDGTATDPGHAAAFANPIADMGCPASGCVGYELAADLDFDTDGSGAVDAADAYWNGGLGWEPIGDRSHPFTAVFDGNGHVITNLYIDRSQNDVGLFSSIGSSSTIRGVGLAAVDVTGDQYTGSLVGWSEGDVVASYASGRVTGSNSDAGGLVGTNESGSVTASYADVAVTGSSFVGGLVGQNHGDILAGYAVGAVDGNAGVGGLVGFNTGTVEASYATGAVTGLAVTGGLVGSNGGTVTASYWDTTTSGQSASAGGVGHTTGELQTPTGYRGIYANWNVDIDGDGSADDPWHFGTASQYPVLQVDVDGDGTASWSELGPQYPNQAPEFVETPPITREVAENTAAGEPIGAPVTAQDDDGDTLAYTLGGADAAVFAVDAGTGQLRTSALLDYETQGAYAVTVEVDDGNGGRASVGVTITVTNVADTPPEAPQNVLATPAETSVELAWDPVAGAALYHVEYRATATPPEPWATADDMVAAPTFTVDVLDCETAHEFRVSAFGDGLAHTEAWGDPSTVVTTTTTTCLLLFDAAPYAFTIGESAAIGDPVGDRPITATDPQGGTVSYAIEAGNAGGAFALHAATGALTLAAALDFVAEHEYSLTVRATSTAGGSRDVDVAIAVQGVDCADGNVIVDPANDKALVADCRVLLAMQEILEGSDAEVQGGGLLNWGDPLRLSQWEGVTASGTPSRVTGLDLSNKLLGGGVPAELSQLTALTTLDLSANRLTEAIPAELSALTHLTTLGLSGNDLSGCIPNVLRALATAMVAAGGTHDLAQLPQDYCDETPPPAPVELAATATTATSVTLAWVGAPDVGTLTYRVQYRIPDPTDPNAPWTEDANDISGASHVVDDLTCGTEHQFQVGAYGDGVARAAAWGPWSTTLAAATAACPLAFDEKSYSFPVKATAGVGTPVGTVSAMPTSGGTVSYAIAAGNTGGAFALAGQTGELTVAGALDPAGYTLTLRATETGGGTATVAVTITVTPVAVSFGAATYTVAESDDATTTGVVENEVEVTVTLSVDPAREVVIPLTVTAQDGASGADYAGVPADLTFASGDTAQSFTFSATHDTEDDDGESVQLGFGPLPSGISAGAIPESVVSLVDDDVPEVTVGFGAAAHAVVEGERVTVTVSLSADPERDVTVPLTVTEQGGATSADYSGVPAGVTFNAGTTSATFDVAAIADTDAEDGESIRLAFGPLPPGVSAGGTTETVVSLSDPLTPVTVSFGAATYAATEGGSVTVTVSLDADPGREVTIPLTVTEQGGATSADYSGVPADVTFSAGVTSTTFDVTATQDTEDDDGESVKLGFGTLPPAVSAGATSETVVSLTDDDVPQVTVSFAAATYGVAEGETVTVTVSLDADPEREVTIPLTVTEQGGATSADYMGVPADVTFTAGVTSTTFDVAATQDTENDDGESVKLAFGTLPPGVSGGATVETVVSLADDDVPQVTVSFGAGTYAATEGETVTVTVTLDADPERAVTVPLTVTEQGGATGADYSGVPADVTFGAGVTSTTFDVAATQDPEDDDGESVRLAFGPLPPGVSGGATIETVVSLADDDVPQVTVSFGAATYDVAEGETVTVTVSLSADPERAVTVPLTVTEQGGATSADYAGVPAEVTFGAGTTSVTFDVMAEDDAADDDGESLALGFGGLPAGVTAGATATTTVNLADTDGPPPVWTATLTVGRYNALLGFQRIGETTTGALSDEAFDWEGRTLRVTDVGYHQAAGLIVIMSGGESVAGLTLQVDDVALAVADAEVFGGPTLRWPGVTLDWTEGQTVQLRLIPSPGNGT